MAELTDGALHCRVCLGDERAFGEIRRRHAAALAAAARAVVGPNGPHEDVVEDVLVRYWQDPPRFDPQRGSMVGYLRLRVRGVGIDLLRSEAARRRREETSSIGCGEAAVEDACVSSLVAQEVRHAVEGLQERERRPILLAYVEGLTYREVATRLGLPEGTVKSRIRSGLVHLRLVLGPLGLASDSWHVR